MFFALVGRTGFASFCEYREPLVDRMAFMKMHPDALFIIYGNCPRNAATTRVHWGVSVCADRMCASSGLDKSFGFW